MVCGLENGWIVAYACTHQCNNFCIKIRRLQIKFSISKLRISHTRVTDLFEFVDGVLEKIDEHAVILLSLDGCDLGQALECDITKHGYVQELSDEGGDEGSFENVAKRDPVEKAQESFECGADECGILGVVLKIHNVQCMANNP